MPPPKLSQAAELHQDILSRIAFSIDWDQVAAIISRALKESSPSYIVRKEQAHDLSMLVAPLNKGVFVAAVFFKDKSALSMNIDVDGLHMHVLNLATNKKQATKFLTAMYGPATPTPLRGGSDIPITSH